MIGPFQIAYQAAWTVVGNVRSINQRVVAILMDGRVNAAGSRQDRATPSTVISYRAPVTFYRLAASGCELDAPDLDHLPAGKHIACFRRDPARHRSAR